MDTASIVVILLMLGADSITEVAAFLGSKFGGGNCCRLRKVRDTEFLFLEQKASGARKKESDCEFSRDIKEVEEVGE